jgi:malonyl-CoA/methylmalonyl-CoA synthetase
VTAAGGPSARSVDAWSRHLGEPVAPDALLEQLTAGTLAEAFHATAVASPDRPALDIDGRARTHGQLDAEAAGWAGALAARGVGSGDAVLIAAPSSIDLVVAYLGALRLGALVVLANPAYTPAELRHLLDDSGAVAAIAGGDARERVAAVGSDIALLDVDAPEASDPVAPVGVASESPALLAYTSGTTGVPKAVPLTHANLLSSIRAAMLAWRWSADDVLVHSLPLSHQHGLGGVHATLLAGSRAVLRSRFDPAATCESIAAARASVLFAVPAMYERLMAWDGLDAADLGTLRLMVSGSAPLSPALAARIEERLGDLPLERYGTTETGLDVSNPLTGARRPGTVGLPLPGVECEVADDAGVPLAPGERGEIVLRGPQVFGGYRGDPETTAAAFHPGGWFRTGDVGRFDPEDGYLEITGRLKELIITGGMNVYPREVELALEAAPGVARAAVVGLPSERWGEEVAAAVVAGPGGMPVAEDVIAFARERLAPYKCPKRVVVVDELPANAMGKLSRPAVAELLELDSALAGYRSMLKRAGERLAEEPLEGAEPSSESWE